MFNSVALPFAKNFTPFLGLLPINGDDSSANAIAHNLPPSQPAETSVLSEPGRTESIDDQIAFHRSNDLLFQLMRAIARATGEANKSDFAMNFPDEASSPTGVPDGELPDSSQLLSFTMQKQMSTSLSFDLEMSDSGLSLDFSFSQEMSRSFEFLSSDGESQTGMSFESTQSRSFDFSLDVSFGETESDPLIIDLEYNGYSFDSSKLVVFDLNADGVNDSFNPPEADNAFLAFDQNKNGTIDNGTELFGDATGFNNGFEHLKSFDENGDNQIDSQDSVFDNLLLMKFNDLGQQILSNLSESGISNIQLQYQRESQLYASARLIAQSGHDESEDESSTAPDLSTARVGDFLLSTRPA